MHADEAEAPDSTGGAADHELDTIGIERPAAEPIQMRRRREGPDRTSDLPIPGSGSGQHLPAETREKMERSFGHDFSSVRVHVGSEPARIGADAYARGNDIHFAPGRFEPSSPDGEQLLGHELAHVVQQRTGRVRAPGGMGAPINTDAALEAEADALGAKAAEGEHAGIGGGTGSAAGSPESAPIQMGRSKHGNRSVKNEDEKKKRKKRKSRKEKKKKKNDDEKKDRKRKISDVKNVTEFEPRKKKRTQESTKKKKVGKKSKKSSFEESYDDGDDGEYIDEKTMEKQLNKEAEDDYRVGAKRNNKPSLNDQYDELLKNRTMVPPQNGDFYHNFFSHEKTGPLLRTLSERAIEGYNSKLTEKNSKKLRRQSQHISDSFHTKEVKDPERYYDTPYDEHSIALDKMKKHFDENKDELDEDESSKIWRQPTPSIRLQPSGMFVTSFHGDDDYDSITKTIRKSIDNKEITTEELGTFLNQPTPKDMRKKLDEVESWKDKPKTDRSNYSKDEEMPHSMNDLYNFGFLSRAVEQQRNPSIGPFYGPLHTQVSNQTVSLEDAFGKNGPYGMITYTGSGTNTNSSKTKTNNLIGLSMAQIEHQNLRDTELGEKSVTMTGTDLDLKDRGMSARNLAKRHGLDLGMTLRAGTPPPPSKEDVEKRYVEMLQRNYGRLNNRNYEDLWGEDFENKKKTDRRKDKKNKR